MWKLEPEDMAAPIVKLARSTIVNVAWKVSNSPQKVNGNPAF